MSDKLITLRMVRDLTALSTTEVYRRIQAGTFPKQVLIGPMSARWSYREIQRWIGQQLSARDQRQGVA